MARLRDAEHRILAPDVRVTCLRLTMEGIRLAVAAEIPQ
jgi:hypothetical protein